MDDESGRPERLVLLPGLRVTARGAGDLAVLGHGRSVRLEDTASVRGLLADLARLTDDEIEPPSGAALDEAGRRALRALVEAGLVGSRSGAAQATARRAAARVLIDGMSILGALAPTVIELLLASGVAVTTRADRATLVLLAGRGDVDRARVEEWSRRDVAHLVVVDRGSSITLGPFVDPGLTCCVFCLDAHVRDPAHAAEVPHLVPGDLLSGPADAPLAAAVMSWAVHDLVTAASGGRPSTWSATVTLGSTSEAGIDARRREWRRHPECGCAWADALRTG